MCKLPSGYRVQTTSRYGKYRFFTEVWERGGGRGNRAAMKCGDERGAQDDNEMVPKQWQNDFFIVSYSIHILLKQEHMSGSAGMFASHQNS